MIKKILITFSLLYLAAIWLAYLLQYLPVYIPIYVPGYISVLSAITFLMYAWDKRSSHKKVNRTPERTLQLLALFGGWPGALLAQQLLRHKSQKRRFIVMLWLYILINAGCSIIAIYFPDLLLG
ncbi:DUF1294 domain-containing protein [Pseudoalteromonas sp. NZS100]|uniref:DUF1294 domain-containing protein n=1 Tax=Pseudoalteromonas sp. NZS100 TaxID=2792046 RepID=UPI0018CCF1DF|nr:DUF1294 domain-containing protein [Pseudoalteromonas sp. NZS100]MBH0066837.1 DUF1294 domain-containing protein [Pseudoalteromonas sp. NZS100]